MENRVTRYMRSYKQMGALGGAAVWRLTLAQGAILETRDQIPRRAPGAWSLLLPLPVSLPLSLSLSLSLYDYHKKKKENKKCTCKCNIFSID